LVTGGAAWPEIRRRVLSEASATLLALPTPDVPAKGGPGNAVDPKRIQERIKHLRVLGGRLLEEWELAEPGDPRPPLFLAEFHLKGGNYPAALAAARRAAAMKPGDPPAVLRARELE